MGRADVYNIHSKLMTKRNRPTFNNRDGEQLPKNITQIWGRKAEILLNHRLAHTSDQILTIQRSMNER